MAARIAPETAFSFCTQPFLADMTRSETSIKQGSQDRMAH